MLLTGCRGGGVFTVNDRELQVDVDGETELRASCISLQLTLTSRLTQWATSSTRTSTMCAALRSALSFVLTVACCSEHRCCSSVRHAGSVRTSARASFHASLSCLSLFTCASVVVADHNQIVHSATLLTDSVASLGRGGPRRETSTEASGSMRNLHVE